MRKALDLDKVRPNNKNITDVKEERSSGNATLINFKPFRSPSVTMRWGMNEYTAQDRIFELKIGKETALLSVEDLMRFTRWV